MGFETLGRSSWPDPFRELRRMQEELARTYGVPGRTAEEFPPLNLWTGAQGAMLTAAMTGVDPGDLEITVHQDTLTLKGARAADSAEDKPTYHRRERRHGSFARTVALPFRVDAEHVEASLEDGILTLMLPRHEAERPKRIEISKS
ncbi:MAG: Hsp20/alpha crystallin family protein [Pseudomonadota bacterium]